MISKYSNTNTESVVIYWLLGFVFVALFVFQQVMSFIYKPFNLVTPYWIIIVGAFFAVGASLKSKRIYNREAFTFALVCSILSILTFLNGSSIGEILCRILYMLFAYWGLVFITNRHIKLGAFDLLLVVLYIIFYIMYFQYDLLTRKQMDPDLFGHSSSNTIAMSLNIVTYIYLMISWVYKVKNKFKLFLFSCINLFLIVIQGSRAGMLVAVLIILILIFTTVNIKSKYKYFLFIVSIIAAISIFVIKNKLLVEDFLYLNEISADSYEADVRSLALSAFFSKMDFTHFLVGYADDYLLYEGINRSFNAFIDFWKVYGLIPFCFMIVLLFKRIIHYKDYTIPLFMLLPFAAYSLFESLWGGSFWDILLFMVLFYTHKDENNKKAISAS